jgi:N-acyl homoserine lactone hydrolase
MTPAGMTLHVLHCGGDRTPLSMSDPLGPNPGRIVYSPLLCAVIKHPNGNVLFDTGFHPRWMEVAGLGEMSVEVSAEDLIGHRLFEVGLTPDDITVVVLSHLHSDHAGGLEHFSHAEIVVQRAERAFALRPPVYQEALYDSRDFNLKLRWRELDGELDVFGDHAIVVVPTPGHTPGHQSAIVFLPQRPVILGGDASYHLEPMRARRLPAVVWSADAMLASWLRLEELQRARNAQLVLSHEISFRRRIRLAPDAHYD